jgi:phosphoglycerol transferase MdoB-like AlkP superfamily enzyme
MHNRRILRLLLPVFSTAVFYALFYAISAVGFDVAIAPKAIARDYLLNLFLAYTLAALSRRLWVFVVLQGLLMALLYVGNAVKISFFGGPIVPDDVYALRTLLLLLEGWQFYLAALPLVGIASLLIFNFGLRNWYSWLAIATVLLVGTTLVYSPQNVIKPLDRYVGHSVWDQRSNYVNRGATLYSLMETARYLADRVPPPDRETVRKAHARLRAGMPSNSNPAGEFVPRNVHIILLESFWDPSPLKAGQYSRDPLPDDFRTLWKQAGNSRILSPVFGGYTANAEFEALCGYPVLKNAVKFERDLKNDVPCLPRLLAQQGYTTIASHPNVPVFWNRVNSYRRLGFQTYWSLQDFEKVDMARNFMSDASLYRQVLEKIEPWLESGKPLLNYVLTYFGHWNYPLNDARPPVIQDSSNVPEVGSFANTAYYKAKELMAFLEELNSRDPDALIAVFGDHPPYLGRNFAGYVESGVLADNRSKFTPEMFGVYNAAPLIVIDGKRGVQRFGTLALYELPARLLRLLHLEDTGPLGLTAPQTEMHVRPIPDLHYLVSKAGDVEVCQEPPWTENCASSSAWLKDVVTLGNDLFTGEQFTMQE